MSAPWPTLQAPPNYDRPPWNWNPAQTFIDAYTTMQENQRAQETFDLGMQLEQILLPAKIAKAEYDTKKFAYDSKLLEKIYRTQSAALDNSYRGVTSAVGGGGQSGAVTGGPANMQTPDPRNAAYGLRNLLSPPTASTPATAVKKPSWKVVRPVTPAATPTGP